MNPHEIHRWPHDDKGSGDPGEDEPDIPSNERGGNVDRIDGELHEAGMLPTDLGAGGLTEEEIRKRMLVRVNEELQAAAELPAKGQAEIKKFLRTIRIPKAEEVSPQEVVEIWEKLGQNPSLIKDLTYMLISRDTDNNLSSHPLMPNMLEILEFIHGIPKVYKPEDSDAAKIRPQIINGAAKDLRLVGLTEERTRLLASSSSGKLAEETRLIGWLAGFEFIRAKARQTVLEQMDVMELAQTPDNLTPAVVGFAFIVIIDKEIAELMQRRGRYNSALHMDRRGLETLENSLQALNGIRDLLYETFLDPLQPKPEG